MLRKGRARDYLIAGVGLGFGCATKYTAGIALLALLAAAASQYLAPTTPRAACARVGPPRTREHGAAPSSRAVPTGRPVLVGLVLAGAAALAAFVIADPYAVLDFHAFEQGLAHQSSLSGEARASSAPASESGFVYYLWTLTWGLGWVPAIAALAGAVMVWWRERKLGWVLVPAPLLYLLFMGSEGRYFGRWLLPIFPILCLLAAFAALQCARVLALAVQGVIEKRAHPAEPIQKMPPHRARGLRWSRSPPSPCLRCARRGSCTASTPASCSRALTPAPSRGRGWSRMCPSARKVVVEPIVPDEWVQDVGHATLTVPDGDRWLKYQSLLSRIGPSGGLAPGEGHVVSLENYELTLAPSLIPYYEREGYCWVVSGSAESGRAFADPSRRAARRRLLPRARAGGGGRLPRLPLPRRGASGRVQLRLVLRLLPARLRPPRPRSDDLSAARRALRALAVLRVHCRP